MSKSWLRDRTLLAIDREVEHTRREVTNTVSRTLNDIHADLETLRVYLMRENVELALGFLDGMIRGLE